MVSASHSGTQTSNSGALTVTVTVTVTVAWIKYDGTAVRLGLDLDLTVAMSVPVLCFLFFPLLHGEFSRSSLHEVILALFDFSPCFVDIDQVTIQIKYRNWYIC